jgi:hypothetical protein
VASAEQQAFPMRWEQQHFRIGCTGLPPALFCFTAYRTREPPGALTAIVYSSTHQVVTTEQRVMQLSRVAWGQSV